MMVLSSLLAFFPVEEADIRSYRRDSTTLMCVPQPGASEPAEIVALLLS
jgi:hypothetical protein